MLSLPALGFQKSLLLKHEESTNGVFKAARDFRNNSCTKAPEIHNYSAVVHETAV
jgi:hypothetical protein